MVNLFLRTAHVLAMLLGAGLASASPEDAAQKARELKELQRAIEAARAELGSLSAARTQEERALRALENQQAAVARALHDARAALERQQAEIERLRARRSELERSIAQGRERLGASIRALYALGPDNPLQGILSPGERADKLRMEGYLVALREHHVRILTGLQTDLTESTQVKAELERGLDHLKALERSAHAEQQRLEELRLRQTQAIAALEAKLKEGEARVEAMRRDQRDLARLVQKLEEAVRQPLPAAPGSDKPGLPKPVDKAERVRAQPEGGEHERRMQESTPAARGVGGEIPVAGRLVRRYGEPTGLGELRAEGHFYAAAQGAPVRAVADGRVVFADWMRGYGQLIILQHAGGYMSLYAHNEAIYKGVGASVRRGEVIGSAGRSGGARQSGLYFEVRRGGQPINPARWAPMRDGR